MTFRFALEGGPHHREVGWFHTPDGDVPTALYVSPSQVGPDVVVSDPVHPFAQGPFTLYRRVGEDGTGKHVYRYERPTT